MGTGPTVSEYSPGSVSSKSVLCDQAVFTSVRSLMGEGYQLVGASPGVMPPEKSDLVRNSPSHNALFQSGDGSAVGLLSYSMASGRRCVSYCCHAGKEQSGRGGQRVYTHMVLLDRSTFALFDSDVTSVHGALGCIVSEKGPILTIANALDPLALNIPTLPVGQEGRCTLAALPNGTADWLWPVAGELLAGRKAALIGLENPLTFLKWLLLILPRSTREMVDVSVNVSFSPTRRLKLILLPDISIHVEKLLAAQTMTLARISQDTPPTEPTFAPWLALLKTLWTQGRYTDMIGLSAQVPGQASAAALKRLAEKKETVINNRTT